MTFVFDNSFARELEGCYVPWKGAPAPAPRLIRLNAPLAAELGLDADALRSPDGVSMLTGETPPPGAEPLAQAYAGHQFGGFSPQLGDGRALLLGEVIDRAGRRRDIQLKGSGRTPFSRGGDGKAALGPVLREYLVSEAMHALGAPTTRALAAVATGDRVYRETVMPGAVLTRVAASHLRVGSFQFLAARGDEARLRRLADYSIARHDPKAAEAGNPYLAFLNGVRDRQAALIAKWMGLGFVHGVMNTDNMTISGETIDYGPCAFMDRYDPATVFSSIDHHGRYAFGNQPSIGQWNLARMGEALLALLADEQEAAVDLVHAALERYAGYYRQAFLYGMGAKLGLADPQLSDTALIVDLLRWMHESERDFTLTFRALSDGLRRGALPFDDPTFAAWHGRWTARMDAPEAAAERMDAANPIYIPRNHLVEEALDAAIAGDLGPFEALLEVVSSPFARREGGERFEGPAPADFGPYRTFCGT